MSKKLETFKECRNKAFNASMESAKCRMQIDILLAKADYLDAKAKYYDTLSNIALDNEQFGFKLEI